MTPTETQQLVKDLHQTYCSATGMTLRLDFERERNWFDFIRRGFTPRDLSDMIRDIRWGIKQGNRHPGALRFSNLVVQVDMFEEQLALLRSRQRAAARTPKPEPGRESALRATGRPAPREVAAEAAPAKSAGQIIPTLIAQMRAAVQSAPLPPESDKER
jgi:hypothetical protein